MLLLDRLWIVLVAAFLGITCAACQSKSPPKPAEKSSKPAVKSLHEEPTVKEQPAVQPPVESQPKPVAAKPKPQQPPPLKIPKVFLSGEHRAACRVNVGDTMPEAELPDPTGKIHGLDSLYGRKFTVICFWTIATHRSRLVSNATLSDLMKDVVKPFGREGVGAIGIDVGDPAAAVEQEMIQTDVTFPCLLDPKGEFFARIAADKRMPRTFLLDATGRILWFDVEYSRTSHGELLQSIRAALGKL